MQTYDIESLPRLKFAHVYHADTYFNTFKKKENSMEITYISEGSITLEWDSQKVFLHKGDVLIAGTAVGRVRVMTNENGKVVKKSVGFSPKEALIEELGI